MVLPSPSQMQVLLEQLVEDMGRYTNIINGSDSTDVVLESGTIPSLRKLYLTLATEVNWIDGGWVTATAYARNDLLTWNGTPYRAVAGHTSGASTQPGVGASWETVWEVFLEPTLDGELGETIQGQFDALHALTITGGGIVTGGGDLTSSRILTVLAATEASVLDAENSTHAVVPQALERKIQDVLGTPFSDENIKAAPWILPDGSAPLYLDHKGKVHIELDNVFTDAEFQVAMYSDNGVILGGLRWDSSVWEEGPFYEGIDLSDAIAFIDGDGDAAVAMDTDIKITYGEVAPYAVRIDGTDVLYKYHDGVDVVTIREDLRALTTLDPSVTKVKLHVLNGQSLSLGGATGAALSTTALHPGRMLMWNGGIRVTNTAQDSAYATFPTPRGNIAELVDAFEETDGTSGETPATGLCDRLLDAGGYDSDTAIIVVCNGVGGQSYDNLKKGTVPYENFELSVRRAWIVCQLLGLELEVVMHWIHGQANVNDAAGVYQGHMEELSADVSDTVQSITGQLATKIYVSAMGNHTAYNVTSSEVMNDILKAVDAIGGDLVPVGPEYPNETVSDGIHLTPAGSYNVGWMHGEAVIRDLANEVTCVRALTAVRAGATITINCEAPNGPLVRDTSEVSDPGDAGATGGPVPNCKYGIVYQQTGGTARVVTNATAAALAISVTLSGDPGSPSAEFVRIAMDGISGNKGGPTTGARACFRDSTSGTHDHGNIRNFIMPARIPVTV